MTTDVIPLGTAAALPTRDRHLSAMAVEREGRLFLFDCGEGTQFRLLHAGLNRARVDAVFVTHLHGDHVYGLPGFAATVGQLQRREPMTVVGPVGLRRFLDAAAGVSGGTVPYGLNVVELEPDTKHALVYETDELTVEARPLDHRVSTFGYRLEERPRTGRFDVNAARALGVVDPRDFGRLQSGTSVTTPDGTTVHPEQVLGPERPGVAVAYVTDTRPCDGGRRLACDADLLYHDATFLHELAEDAVTKGHATAQEAAEVARDAGVRRLLLGHVSARYETLDPLEAEAKAIFEAAEAAVELKRYVLDPRAKWKCEG